MLVLPLLAITLNIACGILGYKVENITEIQNDLKGIVGKPMNNHQGSFAASQNGDVGSLMDALPRKCKKPCGEWVTYLDRCANCQDEEASVECYCRPRFFSPIDKCAKGCPELFDENESGTQLKDVLALLLKVCRCTGHKLKRVNLKRLPGDNYNLEEIMDSECPSGLEDSD